VQKAVRRQRVAVRDKVAVSRGRLSLFCNPLAMARPFGWSGMQVARCSRCAGPMLETHFPHGRLCRPTPRLLSARLARRPRDHQHLLVASRWAATRASPSARRASRRARGGPMGDDPAFCFGRAFAVVKDIRSGGQSPAVPDRRSVGTHVNGQLAIRRGSLRRTTCVAGISLLRAIEEDIHGCAQGFCRESMACQSGSDREPVSEVRAHLSLAWKVGRSRELGLRVRGQPFRYFLGAAPRNELFRAVKAHAISTRDGLQRSSTWLWQSRRERMNA
jgi:hypothetical protein